MNLLIEHQSMILAKSKLGNAFFLLGFLSPLLVEQKKKKVKHTPGRNNSFFVQIFIWKKKEKDFQSFICVLLCERRVGCDGFMTFNLNLFYLSCVLFYVTFWNIIRVETLFITQVWPTRLYNI